MNVDYTFPATPANARKLAYIRTLMNISADDTVMRKAGEHLLTQEEVAYSLPVSLKPFLNERVLDLLQYVKDYDDRCVIGTRSFAQSAAYSLMAAMNTGKKIAVVPAYDQKLGDLWRSFFAQHKLNYQHIKDDQDTIDHDQEILLIENRAMTHPVLNKIRDRVLVFVENAGAGSTGFSLEDLFVNMTYGTTGGFDDYAKEFQKVIASFHTQPQGQGARPVQWWTMQGVRGMVKALHPGLNVENVLTTNQAHQNILLQAGFILNSPKHMARLLGVHVGILTDGAKAPSPAQDA